MAGDEWPRAFGEVTHAESAYAKYYHEYVRETLLADFGIGQVSRYAAILSIGCGPGIELDILSDMGFSNLCGFECSPELRHKARRPHLIEVIDVTAPMASRQSWDVILVMGVLHHIARWEPLERLMANLASLLAPEGRLFIREPRPNLLTRFSLFLARSRVLPRCLRLLGRVPGWRRQVHIWGCQQRILDLEQADIRRWFESFPGFVTQIYPRYFSGTLTYGAVNLVIQGHHRSWNAEGGQCI